MSRTKTILLSLVVMVLWGSLYPCIKLSYGAFSINSGSVPDILLFAAVRFLICGGFISAFCLCMGKAQHKPTGKMIGHFLLIGLFSIVLHYGCMYMGLSLTGSGKTALLKQAGSLLYICLAFLFIKEEKFRYCRILGGFVGFTGIIAINISPGAFHFGMGELLVLIASVCTVIANIISRRSVQKASPYWLTGISQLFGGILLLAVAISLGSKLPEITPKGLLLLGYICAASIVSYLLWYTILQKSVLSNMLIIKFAEPVFACIFSAILFRENILKWQYLLAFILISSGILIGNKTKKRGNGHDQDRSDWNRSQPFRQD